MAPPEEGFSMHENDWMLLRDELRENRKMTAVLVQKMIEFTDAINSQKSAQAEFTLALREFKTVFGGKRA
jgi:hypothetical protein